MAVDAELEKRDQVSPDNMRTQIPKEPVDSKTPLDTQEYDYNRMWRTSNMAGHKVAIITDTHFGIRKGSQVFHDYFKKFYEGTFFPTLDRCGIDTVVHLGDCFDVRKGIDYWSLAWAKANFFDPLRERGIHLHLIVGNHDIFYKQSLSLNSPRLNLSEYDNITIYDAPTTAVLNEVPVFIVPWLCEGNAEEFVNELDQPMPS